MQQQPPGPSPSDYRLNPAVGARFVGVLLVVLAALLLAVTVVVAVLGLSLAVLVGVAVAAVAVAAALAYAGLRVVPVVRLDADGYRVRLVRGAGVMRAAWTDVEEATTSSPAGIPVVVLRLRDGATTTIPVQLLAADREEFVRDLQRHLQHGQGLRPL